MGFLGRIFTPDPILSDRMRYHLHRRSSEILGFALLMAACVLTASLASWSVNDPSLNHATAPRDPENIIGYPGAVIADLIMQTFGLAAPLIIFPLFRWGWGIMTHQRSTHVRLRIPAALLALITASGFIAILPTPSTWPLPTGLGGFLGDGLLTLSFKLTSVQAGSTSSNLIALFFLVTTVAFFIFAIDMRRSTVTDDEEFLDDEEEDEQYESIDEEKTAHSWRGAIIHILLSTQAQLAKRLKRHRANDVDTTIKSVRIKSRRLPDGRVEPIFSDDESQFFEDDDEPFDENDEPFDDINDEEEEEESEEELDDQDTPSVTIMAQRHRLSPAQKKNSQKSWLKQTYKAPPLNLLDMPKPTRGKKTGMSQSTLANNANMLEQVLDDFGVKGEIINVRPGPVVTLYELEPAPGIKSSRVIGLADDIARSMSAIAARVAVVSGRNVIGIELPNATRETVYLRELLGSDDFARSKARLPMALGKIIGGEPVITDLARMPHLLIAGTTGSGKSVGINTMILSLLYRLTPEQCRLIMIDPKMLELSVYDGIPHLLTPVVTDPKKAIVALKWSVHEMEERYKKMSKLGVRNIDGFNQRVKQAAEKGESITRTVQTGFDRNTGKAIYESEEMKLEPMPYLVIIVDEMADLMMVAGKDIEGTIQRLAQMARAAGIHIIMATQRPSVDVITGTIKANFPTRISFQVTSKIDSRTILGEQGAEQLLGQGDMLYMAGGGRISRVHGPFVSDENVENIVRHLKKQGTPDYLDAVTEENDPESPDMVGSVGNGESNDLYDRAVQIVLHDRKASTSYIQRRLSIGYNRAATLIERMEQEGLISAANHSGKREILVGDDMN